VRESFKRDQLSAGLTNPIGIHGLRHTFASHFIMNGGNIYDLKTLMGHSDVATTMRYVHLGGGHLREKALLVQLQLPNRNNVFKMARP
jgi:site-specific recombinase XerD